MDMTRPPCVLSSYGDGRQPARGSNLVISLYRMVYGEAAALRRQVPHCVGLLVVVRSIFLDFSSTRDHVSMATSWVGEGW